MYRSAELRQYQYYVNPEWAGKLSPPRFLLDNADMARGRRCLCQPRTGWLSVGDVHGSHLSHLIFRAVPGHSSQEHGQRCIIWAKSMSSGINPVKQSHVALRGYISSCRDIVGAAKTIKQAIENSFPELFILGNPQASVVAFGSRTPSLNILEVGDRMSKKGWHLNALQNPPGLHIACTVRMCCQDSQQDLMRGCSD